LQPANDVASFGVLNHESVNLSLPLVFTATSLTDINQFGVGSSFGKKFRMDQPVMKNHVRATKAAAPFDGNEVGITRSGPDNIDKSFHPNQVALRITSRTRLSASSSSHSPIQSRSPDSNTFSKTCLRASLPENWW